MMSKRKMRLSRKSASRKANESPLSGLKWAGKFAAVSFVLIAAFLAAMGYHYWFVPHTLKKLITPYGKVIYSSRSWGATQDIYLIGQEHYYPATGKRGPEDREQDPALPRVQSQIYRILDLLWKKRQIELVVGEGLPPGEFRIDPTKSRPALQGVRDAWNGLEKDQDAILFFVKNIKQTAYWAYEIFHPERTQIWGVNDQAEQARVGALEQESFAAAVKYTGTLEEARDPWKRQLRDEAVKKICAEKDIITDRRSAITVKESLEISKRLFNLRETRNRNCIIVIGSFHLPLMTRELLRSGRRLNLYCILPSSARHLSREDITEGRTAGEMHQRGGN